MNTPVLVLSMGDPAGIGPELMLKAAADPELTARARLVIVANHGVLARHAERMGLPCELPIVRAEQLDRETLSTPVLVDVETDGIDTVVVGKASAAGGVSAVACIDVALTLVRQKRADALVTGPINKVALGLAEFPWAGHTDLLKERTRAPSVVMMLVGGGLRVGLVTHHLALSQVSKRLTLDGVLSSLRVMHAGLRRFFGIAHPRLAVAGLNPHASDGGRFGTEEADVIGPAVRLAQGEGIACGGPFPADTLFTPAMLEHADAVLAMYHDQGLIPLKMKAFGRAVNVTLGLPVVRTSVDHGTAYDIAGKGVASTGSLAEAVRLAADIVERTHVA